MSRRTKVARTEADATDVAKQIEVEDKEVTEKRKYKDAHFAKLKEVISARGAKGSALIIAIEPNEEDEDEDEGPDAVYTKEQIDSLRHILVNKSREGFINKAMAMVFMDGEGTTSAGNAVIMSIIPWINKAKKQKTNALRFDALFVLTYALLQEDLWMHDNELYGPGESLEKGMVALGKAWSELLPLSDEELDIDPEYTRPGIIGLLERFKKEVEEVDSYENCKPIKWTK
eukprot:gene7644-9149_t